MIRFLPRETKFFDLFAELSTAMNEGARLSAQHSGRPSEPGRAGRRDAGHRASGRQGDPRHYDEAEPELHHALRPRRYLSSGVVARRRSRLHEYGGHAPGDVQNRPTHGGGSGTGGNPGAAKRRTGARRFSAREKWQGDAALRRSQPAGGRSRSMSAARPLGRCSNTRTIPSSSSR